MTQFRSYSGEEFFSAQFPKRQFLIDDIIREKDSVIVLGDAKTGKSVLIFQLLCSLTSQHPFLDAYSVHKPCNVSYVQLEGEIEDYHERLMRMVKVLEVDPSRIHYKYSSPVNLASEKEANELCKDIRRYHKTLDVLILDPLYFTFKGSLSDDALVRSLLGNLRIIKDFFSCALILVHHTHKVRWMGDGLKLNEGDDASFGSVFFKAWPDHILLLELDKKSGLRTLTCGTQRSGTILSSKTLRMVQPDPLYYEVSDPVQGGHRSVELLEYLKKSGPQTYQEIQAGLSISSSSFYYSIKPLIIQKLVGKDTSTRPMLYRYL